MNTWTWCATLLAISLLPNSRSNAQNQQTLTIASSAHKGDQVVIASTRNFPSSVGRTLDLPNVVSYSVDATGQRQTRKIDLLEKGEFVETWIFVHGNQITPEMAVDRGARVYRNLRAKSASIGPIRFVIWSWPSERRGNRFSDAKLKAKRTDVESFYLGSYLAAIASDGPVSIIAYSFGARVVSGALHLNAGGSLCGYYLPQAAQPVVPYRLAFLAAAVEHDGLLMGGRYQSALNHTNRLLLQNNSADKVLRFFWLINQSRSAALGHTGLSCAPSHCLIQQFDWSDIIKRDHSVWQYMDRPIIVRRVIDAISRLP